MTHILPNLRINADDFGLSPAISRAIVRSASAGLINSVSVVPFKDPESQVLLRELAAMPGVHIGAHLTFIEVPLLTRPLGFPSGWPPADYRQLLRASLRGRIRSEDVRREWRAQIELLSERIGRSRIHHLDSHQHIHVLPALWKVVRSLQHEYGVPVLRRPYESSRMAWLKQFPMGVGLQLLALARAGQTTETFLGVGTSMAFTADAYRGLNRQIARHPQRRYELMVHPDESARGQREIEELTRWLSDTSSKPA